MTITDKVELIFTSHLLLKSCQVAVKRLLKRVLRSIRKMSYNFTGKVVVKQGWSLKKMAVQDG